MPSMRGLRQIADLAMIDNPGPLLTSDCSAAIVDAGDQNRLANDAKCDRDSSAKAGCADARSNVVSRGTLMRRDGKSIAPGHDRLDECSCVRGASFVGNVSFQAFEVAKSAP